MRAMIRSLFIASLITFTLALPSTAAEDEELGLKGGAGFFTQYVFKRPIQTDRKHGIKSDAKSAIIPDRVQSNNLEIASTSLKLEVSLHLKETVAKNEIYDEVDWKGIDLKLSDTLGNNAFATENARKS